MENFTQQLLDSVIIGMLKRMNIFLNAAISLSVLIILAIIVVLRKITRKFSH